MTNFHANQYTSMIISSSVLLRVRNISDKSCRENQNTPLMFNLFFSKILPFVGQCGKNAVKPDRPLMKIRHIHIAYWIPKATYIHTYTQNM